MSYSSKKLPWLTLVALLALLMISGCMQNSPHDTDMPWSGPASWEGTMPLPGSVRNQYE